MLLANVSTQDIKIASVLGKQLFRAFCSDCNDPLFVQTQHGTPLVTAAVNSSGKAVAGTDEESGVVLFSNFAAGLAFLCGGSPTEVNLLSSILSLLFHHLLFLILF